MSRLWERAGLNINWFPGHMASAARKIEQRLKVVDMVRFPVRAPWGRHPVESASRRTVLLREILTVCRRVWQVIEVRDARVPLCSRCGRLEELIQNKRRIIVMNKSDLIGAADQERWARHLAQQGQAVAFTSANKGSRIGELMPQELLKRGLLARADRMLLFMIIGIPNTGKSTMINALRRNGMRAKRQEGGGGNVAETGARPGVTRHVSTMQFCSEPPVAISLHVTLVSLHAVWRTNTPNRRLLSRCSMLCLSCCCMPCLAH